MAGNIQLVFFRKKGSPEDVIVKLLLHEHEVSIPVKTDMAPFYHWQDVRAFYKGIVDSLPDRPLTYSSYSIPIARFTFDFLSTRGAKNGVIRAICVLFLLLFLFFLYFRINLKK